jgi:NarL family two-component system sensor histidine kinase LiaS
MTRYMRSSKWEWSLYSGVSTLVAFLLIYSWWIWTNHSYDVDWAVGWAVALLAVSMTSGYVMGRRSQRRIDQLQLAMKQAMAGNWHIRLKDVRADFNRMLGTVEGRLKLLQQLGEKGVLEEASSREAAVLEERRRLARDLHDTVSQHLFALHMSASSLPKLLERNDSEQANKVMEHLIAMSSAAQRQMRGLIAQLRPLELQGKSLEEGLDLWFPDYCRQNGLQGFLDVELVSGLSEAIEHQLFLIIQEAMANVVKHAEAGTVRLSLGETDRTVTLQIEDNGSGFNVEQVRSGAYGLSTMRERAQKLGGEAEVVTKPGSGTRVRIRFPKFGRQGDN